MKKETGILIVVLIVCILFSIGFYSYMDDMNIKNGRSLDWQERFGKKDTIMLYAADENQEFSTIVPENREYNTYKYQCVSDNCEILGYGENHVLVSDDGYYLYSVKRKKSLLISIEREIKNGQVLVMNNQIYGILFEEVSGNTFYYSVIDEKMYLDGYFDSFDNLSKYSIVDNRLLGYIDEKEVLYDLKTNKVLLENDYKIDVKYNKNGDYYYQLLKDFDTKEHIIVTRNMRKLLNGEVVYNSYINKDGNFVVLKKRNDQKFYILDANSKLLKESNNYESIYMLIGDDYVVLEDDNHIKLYNTNEKLLVTFVEMTENLIFHDLISGYFEQGGREGIYLIFEDTNIKEGTIGHGLEYYYIPSNKEQGLRRLNEIGAYAKPIIYLYPKEKTNVKIRFKNANLLTTTYPKYNKLWDVLAYPNGDLYDQSNKYYYGLYYEETPNKAVDFNEGFYVTKENAINFLEEKLHIIGLNDKERNEFIMYWLPILEKNEKSLVYFELTDSREQTNKLIISPKPDSLLRVAIHIKKVSNEVSIQEQKLSTFERKGFTAVEWGGRVY